MSNTKRITLEVSVPKTQLDPNDVSWDWESFVLREHLFKLIEAYGYDVLKQELHECEWIKIQKDIQKKKTM